MKYPLTCFETIRKYWLPYCAKPTLTREGFWIVPAGAIVVAAPVVVLTTTILPSDCTMEEYGVAAILPKSKKATVAAPDDVKRAVETPYIVRRLRRGPSGMNPSSQ